MYSGFTGDTDGYTNIAGVVGGAFHNGEVAIRFGGTTQATVRNSWLLAVDRLNVYRAQGWSTSCCTEGGIPATPTITWTINNGPYSSGGQYSDWQWVAPGIPDACVLQLCGPAPAPPRQGLIQATQSCHCCRCCSQVRHDHALWPNTE
jgi:hypothetical protein